MLQIEKITTRIHTNGDLLCLYLEIDTDGYRGRVHSFDVLIFTGTPRQARAEFNRNVRSWYRERHLPVPRHALAKST